MSTALSQFRPGIFALVFAVLIGTSAISVVTESEQAVIEWMGQPDRVINRFRPGEGSGAGLVAKIPLIETLTVLPRGLVTLSLPAKRVKTGDQHWLLADTDVTYRIIDPVKLTTTLGSAAKTEDQLKALLPSLLDKEVGQRSAVAVAQPGAGGANQVMRQALDAEVRQYGLQVIDLRIARVALDEASLNSAYERMVQRHEATLAEIEVRSANDALAVTSAAEAEATARRKRSADQDPEFYSFYRAMRSYDELYGDPKRKNTVTIVLPPDSGYLEHFGGK